MKASTYGMNKITMADHTRFKTTLMIRFAWTSGLLVDMELSPVAALYFHANTYGKHRCDCTAWFRASTVGALKRAGEKNLGADGGSC